jgi:hypothetical protein
VIQLRAKVDEGEMHKDGAFDIMKRSWHSGYKVSQNPGEKLTTKSGQGWVDRYDA